ncbi:MAG: hypothetical protein V1494_00360 [Candidatus Diapherotrites archaeon]
MLPKGRRSGKVRYRLFTTQTGTQKKPRVHYIVGGREGASGRAAMGIERRVLKRPVKKKMLADAMQARKGAGPGGVAFGPTNDLHRRRKMPEKAGSRKKQ